MNVFSNWCKFSHLLINLGTRTLKWRMLFELNKHGFSNLDGFLRTHAHLMCRKNLDIQSIMDIISKMSCVFHGDATIQTLLQFAKKINFLRCEFFAHCDKTCIDDYNFSNYDSVKNAPKMDFYKLPLLAQLEMCIKKLCVNKEQCLFIKKEIVRVQETPLENIIDIHDEEGFSATFFSPFNQVKEKEIHESAVIANEDSDSDSESSTKTCEEKKPKRTRLRKQLKARKKTKPVEVEVESKKFNPPSPVLTTITIEDFFKSQKFIFKTWTRFKKCIFFRPSTLAPPKEDYIPNFHDFVILNDSRDLLLNFDFSCLKEMESQNVGVYDVDKLMVDSAPREKIVRQLTKYMTDAQFILLKIYNTYITSSEAVIAFPL
jgi:hypothetical protein